MFSLCFQWPLKTGITVCSFQVPPAYLEDIIVKHPGVLDAAVVGVPVSGGDELPKAFIVRCQDYNVTEEDIKKHVQGLYFR